MTRQTSLETYHKIKEEGLLSSLRQTVYSALYKHGPCTANELVKKMAAEGKSTKSRDFFAQRLSELRDVGVAAEYSKKTCSVTGRSAIVWDVTKKLPIKLEKPTETKCQHCNGTGKTKTQQTRMF